MARATVTEETALPRGKRPKRGKAPTKLERLEKLRERILTLGRDLVAEGFSAQVPPPAPIRLTAEAIRDPKTGGWLGHVEEPLVNDTFLRFFSGVTSELEWEDTAGQILGD